MASAGLCRAAALREDYVQFSPVSSLHRFRFLFFSFLFLLLLSLLPISLLDAPVFCYIAGILY